MGSVKLQFAVSHYQPLEISDGKVPLKLAFYVTTPGKPSTEIRTIDSDCFVGEITINAPKDHATGQPFIPHDTQFVIMDFYAVKTPDRVKVDAVNQLGTARFPLRDLLGGKLTHAFPLIVKNAVSAQSEWNGVQSHIELTFAEPELEGCESPLLPEDEMCIDANNYALAVEVLNNVQKSDQGIYRRLQPTFPSLRGLQEPMDQFDDLVVPGSCFVDFCAEPSPEEFYVRISRAALFRCYPKLSQSEAEAHVLSPKCTEAERADVLATMFTVYSNFCTYLGDGTTYTVDGKQRRTDYEYFSNHLRTGQCATTVNGKAVFYPPSGDCEDLQNEQAHQAMDFKDRCFKDPLLQKLVETRNDYLYAMSIMGVRGGQLSDGMQKEKKVDPYANQGGHSAGKLYRKETLLKEHGLVNAAKPLFPTITAPADFNERFDRGVDIVRILEGTGPAHVREFDARENQEMERALIYLKGSYDDVLFLKPLSYNPCTKLNDFYRSVHVLEFPDLAAEGYRNSSFVVLNMKTPEPTLGATYTDFMNPSERLGLRAQPERSDEEIAVLNRLMLMYPPIRAHQIPGEPECCPVRGPLYDTMYELCRKTAAKKIAKRANATPVLFITPYNMLTLDSTIEGLQAISKMPRVCAIEAHEVALDEACGGYNIKVWVNPQ
jgi:hypothetical protein